MSKYRFVAILLLVLIAAPGCYTQLRQPPADLSSYSEPPDAWEGRYAPPGFDIYDAWTYPYYTSLYGPVPWTWAPYYYYPGWWWSDPWGHPPGPPSGPAQPVETGGRHGWGRGPGAPYVPGIGGTAGPGRPSSGGQPAVTQPAEPNPPTPSNPPGTDREKPSEPKEEEPKRHGWGR